MNIHKVTDYEKKLVTNYMYANNLGYKQAQPRKMIADDLGIEDRRFREVCSEIPEIITSVKYGYYLLPLTDPTGEETRVAREILEHEDRRRIVALYLRNRRQRQAIKRMEAKEQQKEFALI
jgi:hypothetical protein